MGEKGEQVTTWQIVGIGYAANAVAYYLVDKYVAKDPTHEDVLDGIALLVCLIPFAFAFFSVMGSIVGICIWIYERVRK